MENRLFDERIRKYQENFRAFGNSEITLDMPSDRRNIRYYELVKNFDFFIKKDFSGAFSLCDAGCGFGDINQYLQRIGYVNYQYVGIDVVPEFVEECQKNYVSPNRKFLCRNFMEDSLSDLEFDYAVSSQAFTIAYSETQENYTLIFKAVENLFRRCRIGVSFNFFSDYVDFKKEGTAYHNPLKMLEFAYSLSRNVILDNSCLPYECTITILKEVAATDGMVFDRFKRLYKKEFDEGIFVVKEK